MCIGTRLVSELAGEFGVEVVVLVSTERKNSKAKFDHRAGKHVAELVVRIKIKRFATNTVAVRFGNVIGSTGSVIPRSFETRSRKAAHVTVSHRRDWGAIS